MRFPSSTSHVLPREADKSRAKHNTMSLIQRIYSHGIKGYFVIFRWCFLGINIHLKEKWGKSVWGCGYAREITGGRPRRHMQTLGLTNPWLGLGGSFARWEVMPLVPQCGPLCNAGGLEHQLSLDNLSQWDWVEGAYLALSHSGIFDFQLFLSSSSAGEFLFSVWN